MLDDAYETQNDKLMSVWTFDDPGFLFFSFLFCTSIGMRALWSSFVRGVYFCVYDYFCVSILYLVILEGDVLTCRHGPPRNFLSCTILLTLVLIGK